MKNKLLLLGLLMVSCTSTTVKRDDHSYSYYYNHNEAPSEESSFAPKPKSNKRVEYTTYKQEYNNFKSQNSDSEYLEDETTVVPPRFQKSPSRREFNPYDNQFINSSHRRQEEQVPDIFGPEGYVNVQTRVPNSNPPIIKNIYYPASAFR